MATTTPLAYNTGSPIGGTSQIGDLAVGITAQDYSTNPGGVPWWMGPDEELGYVIAVPVAGNTQPTPVTQNEIILSSTYRGSDIVLSNGNQTASQQFGYQQSVLGIAPIGTTDKVMFSVLVSLAQPSTLPNTHFVGIGYTSMNYQGDPYGAFPGNDTSSMGYGSDGNIWYNGGIYAGGLLTWGNGDIIDIVVDNNVNGLWVRVNGGFWNNNDAADPAAGTYAIETIGSPFYPVLCPGYEGTMTVQNSPTYNVPSGYLFLGETLASVGFYRSENLTDNSFIQLTNQTFNQNFSSATDASTWLTTNGYWNSYGGFTLSQADFVNANWGTYISPLTNQNDGFQTTGQSGPGEAFYGPWLSLDYGGNPTKLAEIRNYWSSKGLNTNTNAYMFNVIWGSGSTLNSGVVIMGFYDYGDNNTYLDLGVVNTSNPIWQTSGTGYYSGPILTLAGTWTFPATFTLIQPPIINGNNWC